MAWRVADSLGVLLAEINAVAPNRSTISDGSIGDAAHATTNSDHNPWVKDADGVGVVRARDFTHDPADNCDAGAMAEHVRQLGFRGGHPALGSGAYVISNRRIASGTYGWVWRNYTGSNPHDKHFHVSVTTSAAGYDSTAPWGITEEDEMNEAQEKKVDNLAAEVAALRQDVATVLKRLDSNGAIRTRLKQIADLLNTSTK